MIEPINFVGAVRRRWRLIVVLAALGALVALLIPVSQPKHPKTLLKWETVASVGSPSSNGILQGAVSNAQIAFYANTFPIKLAAVSDVGLAGNPYVYAGGMFGSLGAIETKGAYPTGPVALTGSAAKAAAGGGVSLYASAPTAVLAADLCNAYAKELGDALEKLVATHEQASASTSKNVSAAAAGGSPFAATATGYQVIFPGTPELAKRINQAKPSQFNSHKVRLIGGLIGGVLLAIVLILIREVLNKTIRREHRAEVHFKFPVVADIPETYPPDPGVVDVVDRPTSPAAEAYRKLRMSVLFESMAADATAAGADPFSEMFGVSSPQTEPYKVPEPGSRSVLLVVSTVDEASRPKVVANLAATYAEASEHVIVVSSGDLEVGTAFPAESVLSGPVTPADIESRLTPAGPDNVSLLSLRHFMRNSGQLVTRSKEVFDAARQVADVVIVEAPAFLRFHHAEAMAHSVDAVIVVAESGVTAVPDAQDMGEILRRLGAPVLGVVFTGEELSKAQRRVLGAGMAASGRHRDALDASVVEEDGSLDPVGPADDAVTDPTPELHPS